MLRKASSGSTFLPHWPPLPVSSLWDAESWQWPAHTAGDSQTVQSAMRAWRRPRHPLLIFYTILPARLIWLKVWVHSKPKVFPEKRKCCSYIGRGSQAVTCFVNSGLDIASWPCLLSESSKELLGSFLAQEVAIMWNFVFVFCGCWLWSVFVFVLNRISSSSDWPHTGYAYLEYLVAS